MIQINIFGRNTTEMVYSFPTALGGAEFIIPKYGYF